MTTQTELLDHPKAIAIIGMACRFPGARNLEEFRHNLAAGIESITYFSDAEMLQAGVPQTLLEQANYVKAAPVLDGIDQFDASFFHYSQRDAETMDPQHRLFLECAWEALENAGHAATDHGCAIGVFGGGGSLMGSYLVSESHINHQLRGPLTGREHIGNDKDHLCTKVSYKLNLRGPSVTIQTACSTSLVAVHLACQSLLNGECEMALAGGVTIRIPHRQGYLYEEGGVFSPDGHCRAFDAEGKGTVFSSGVGLVVLKPLKAALADGDLIKAVIRGSAINNDGGEKFSYWATNVQGQADAIQRAFTAAAVAPSTIGYIETHGTATHLGDYIEISALKKAFQTDQNGFCAIGSVKTNIGHTDAASGVAGLIKAVLSLEDQVLYPSLHFSTPNPRLGLEKSPFFVNTKLQPWRTPDMPRRAAVNSLGIGGTNAHVVLEEAPRLSPAQTVAVHLKRPFHLLTLSAKSPEALRALGEQYQHYLKQMPDLAFADICYSANSGRAHFAHRLALVASSAHEAAKQLAAYTAQEEQAVKPVKTGTVDEEKRVRVAFLFTGQGAQYLHMGRQLYETQSLFRQRLQQCDVVLQECLGRSLLELLYPQTAPQHNDLMDSHPCGQATNYAIECALADLWRAWGVEPAVVLGHSLGDFAAAYTAGVLSLEDGLRLVTERGRLMEQALGSMVSVLATEAELLPFLAGFDDVAVGVINGPQSVVISGGHDSVAIVTTRLHHAGFKVRKLDIPVAAHSPLLDPILDDFEAAVRNVTLSPPRCAVVSSMTGKSIKSELTDPRYWRNHLRNTVRFADGVQTLASKGYNIFLEIGPKPTLLPLVEQGMANQPSYQLLASLRQGQDDWQQMFETLAELYVAGAPIAWKPVDQGDVRRKVVLPTYPFQRQRYWLTAALNQKPESNKGPAPLIDKMIKSPRLKETIFETSFSTAAIPFLADHYVYDQVAVPGACHLGLLLNACRVGLGEKQVRLEDVVFPTVLTLAPDQVRTVQAIFTPQNKNNGVGLASSFEVISFPPDQAEEEPLTHAIGQLTLPPTTTMRTLALPQLQERCAASVDPEQIYSRVDAKQIHLGPTFRWFDAVWRGEQEVLAQMRIPAALGDTADYLLHPTLIDACFQLTSATWPDDREADTLLPFSVDALHLYQPVVGAVYWAHVRQVATYQWDIQLFLPNGELLADIVGYQMRPAAATALQRKDGWRNWLYLPEWQPCPRLDTPSLQQASGQKWLLFTDVRGVGASLAQELSQRGGEPILVYAKDTYQQVEDHLFGIRHTVAEDYDRLFSAIQSVDQVVYLWGLENQSGSATDTEQSCGSLLYLVQALLTEGREVSALWLVTRASQAVRADEAVAGVGQAALWGIGKVIGLEHPELRPICVDLDPQHSAEEHARMLCAELIAHSPNAPFETQIALRESNTQIARYVARLKRFVPQPAMPLTIRADATYLITGGLGGLGLAMAEWLAAQGARQLVLLGRRPPQSQTQVALAALRAQGVTVTVAQADVTNLAALQSVFAAIEQGYPLAGVVHAAGHLHDAALLQQSWQAFAEVLAPKVQGAWHLHQLSKGLTLDFFVLFSSATSLLGNAGQANHAAANAFLDAFAHYRHAQGLPAQSINWGAWSEIGAAAEMMHDKRHFLTERGIGDLSPQQGLAAFASLLTQAAPQVGVLPIHWSKYLADETRQQPFLAELIQRFSHASQQEGVRAKRVDAANMREKLASLPEEERDEQLLHFVRSETAHILGIAEPQSVPLQQPLFEFGIDSLMALQLKNRLQSALHTALHPTLVFDYPTVSKLTNYLLATLFRNAQSTAHEKTVTNDKPSQSAEHAAKIHTNAQNVAISPEIDQLSGADLLDLINQFGKNR